VYLGVLVCPLAAYGLWRTRHDKLTPVWALAFCLSLILSIGQVVIHNESPVKLLGIPLYMPFAIWRTIPFFGTMWQSGRYFLIGYCVLAVGIGLLVASIRNPWLRAAIFALIVIDYMPHIAGYSAPTFSGQCLREAKTVLDSRRTGIAMYYQTVHGRPMVGGYISRSPQRVLDEYRRIPGMDCLFWSIGCEAQRAREAADRLSISHIIVARNDKRSPYFAAFGFDLVYTDPYSEIWKVTPPRTVTK
jgi:hypothetical protein